MTPTLTLLDAEWKGILGFVCKCPGDTPLESAAYSMPHHASLSGVRSRRGSLKDKTKPRLRDVDSARLAQSRGDFTPGSDLAECLRRNGGGRCASSELAKCWR
jgi:hypothetical protein